MDSNLDNKKFIVLFALSAYFLISVGIMVTILIDDQESVSTTESQLSNNGEMTHEPEDNKVSSVKKADESVESDNDQRYVRNLRAPESDWKLESEADIKYKRPYIYEVDKHRDEKPTERDYEAAWELYNSTYEAARQKNWFDYGEGIENGYKNTYSRTHYVNLEIFHNNGSLNPERPEFLMYRTNGENKKVLTGVMYMKNSVDKAGEQIAGSLTQWHYHTFSREKCYYNGFSISVTDNCPNRYWGSKSPEMIHVWFVDHPEGAFGTQMGVTQEIVNKGPEKLNKSDFIENEKKSLQRTIFN